MTGEEAPRPLLRVVRGDPTDEELAALVAVIASRAATPPPAAEAGPPRTWSAYWRSVGATPRPGPGAWRGSALPR